MAPRGTSNANARGNCRDRLARRQWLVETYRANVDVSPTVLVAQQLGIDVIGWQVNVLTVPVGEGVPACRCYRCGELLTVETVTVDRIIPGCEGGTYRRDNIRPACGTCNESTGGRLGNERRRRAS